MPAGFLARSGNGRERDLAGQEQPGTEEQPTPTTGRGRGKWRVLALLPLLAAGGSDAIPRGRGSGEEKESPEARNGKILGDLCDVRRRRGREEVGEDGRGE
jgi:hypothetical protein